MEGKSNLVNRVSNQTEFDEFNGERTLDPIDEIISEREKARERGDLNANVCFLATVTEEGAGTVRALSLRDIDHRGFGVLVNGLSVKWAELQSGRGFELLMYWPTVSRQYRIRGRLTPMDEEDRRRYWDRKSHGSKLLEHYYPTFEPQTTVVPSRERLVCRYRGVGEDGIPTRSSVPLPDSLVGVYVVPEQIETWHSGEGRLHDRHRYTRTADGWKDEVLVP